jgi:acetyltransferase-like isoleucine patch superfamily enzyme
MRIGPNSIMEVSSVVVPDAPPNTVLAVVPAREILKFDEYI